MRHTSHTAGFTLIELMLTIVVMAILLAIAVPSFSNILGKNRLKSAAEQLVSETQYARSEAIAQNRETSVTVAVAAADDWCVGVSDVNPPAACDCTDTDPATADCTIDGQVRVTQGDRFAPVNITSGAVFAWFDPVRGLPSGSGRVDFQNEDGKQVAVRLTQLGSLDVCTPTGGNVPEYPECP